MNLENSYWYFDRVLPKKFCKDVIKYGKTKEEELAITGQFSDKGPNNLSQKDIKDLKKKRDSNVVWLDDQWIYKEILTYVNVANENAKWNFHWDWAESCQFTKYGVGQYYGWHCDTLNKPYDETGGKNLVGKIRKLSMTINLTETNEYEGGNLEFDLSNPDNKNNIISAEEARSQGSVIIFPSHLWHRVTPVTKGVRYSLVVWCCGNTFV